MRTKRIPLLLPILRAAALGSTMLVGLGAPPAAAGENCGSGTGSGINAVACGTTSTASGLNSSAYGNSSTASGFCSAAYGTFSVASG